MRIGYTFTKRSQKNKPCLFILTTERIDLGAFLNVLVVLTHNLNDLNILKTLNALNDLAALTNTAADEYSTKFNIKLAMTTIKSNTSNGSLKNISGLIAYTLNNISIT